jgi:hypothetical protein
MAREGGVQRGECVIGAPKCILAVYANLCWRRVLSPGFLASYYQQGLVHFFISYANTAPTTLSAIQAASQSTFINEQLYTTCDELEQQK